MARLSRAYPAIAGRPIIEAVDLRIFRLRYFRNCLSCSFCSDQCCRHGVDVDAANAEDLLSLSSEFEALVGHPRSEWFTGPYLDDAEFPSGQYIRTAVNQGYCVFHDARARGCKIHAWCSDSGIDFHSLKPIVSILFPVTFENGVLMPSTEVTDSSLICSGQGDSLFDGARKDLNHYFGEAFVDELDGLQGAQDMDQVARVEPAAAMDR
ncbi:MAG: hypothetical protein JOZ55_02980 [Alphaproteobacteria bacterium]|nr:hypothetical protein [Alphaproteobacteria bacterium]